MIYLKPSSKRWQKKMLSRGALILLALIILLILNVYPPNFLRQPLINLATPFWQIQDWGADLLKAISTPFTNKNKLLEENTALKNELAKKNLTLAALEDLAIENQEFKELGGRQLDQAFVLATIISRPPISPYDTFVIDAGSEEGITVGNIVLIEENSAIGEVASVAKNSAVVSLYSTPDRETMVAVGLERAEAPARGRGGGNFELRMPKGVVVEIDDVIVLPSINHRLLGLISKIEISPNDPFQTILFSLPINLNNLRFVMIVKK